MKVLLAVLPSFQSDNFLIPHLGNASIKAYLAKHVPDVTVNTIDLRDRYSERDLWGPRDFHQMTHKKLFVSDIYDLPMISSIIYKFKKYHKLNDLITPEKEVTAPWSIERSVFPDFTISSLNLTHSFALKNLTKFGGYDVVGFSLYTSNMYFSVLMALLIKLTYPKTKIVFGGPQITQGDTTRELLIKGEVADYLILGEGEQPMLELINCIREGTSPDKITGIKTLSNFDDMDTFYQEMDLDELPTPDYFNLNFNIYIPRIISIYSNRGCPFRCHFCSEHSLFGKRFKRRSAEKVIEDMRILSHRHDINNFVFSDSLLNSSNEWLEEFIELLSKSKDKFKWSGYFRAEMENSLIKKMKAVGLQTATLGVESFSQDTLNKMNKKKVQNETLDTIYSLIDNEVKIFANLFVGYPGEKESDFMATLGVSNNLYNEFRDKNKLEFFNMTTRNFQLRPFSNIYRAYSKFGIKADTWEKFYSEQFHLPELKNVFEKTLYSFSVNDVSLEETHHRLSLINQIKRRKSNEMITY